MAAPGPTVAPKEFGRVISAAKQLLVSKHRTNAVRCHTRCVWEGVGVDPLDLRLLRYFAAVAEERNFTRAAERLGMAQPPLSRAVRQLERLVGTALFVRGHRQVSLTAAGAVLLQEARDLDDHARAALARTRNAALAPRPLRVSAKPIDSALLHGLVRSYQPATGAGAEIVVTACRRQVGELRTGQVDAALVRSPFRQDGLDTQQLFSERRLGLVRAGHPLAAASRIPLHRLAEEPVPVWRGADKVADDYWAAADLDHHPWRRGPQIDDLAQLLAVVAMGNAVAFVPESLFNVTPLSRELAVLDVVGLSNSTLHMAWPHSASLLVSPFVRHVQEHVHNV